MRFVVLLWTAFVIALVGAAIAPAWSTDPATARELSAIAAWESGDDSSRRDPSGDADAPGAPGQFDDDDDDDEVPGPANATETSAIADPPSSTRAFLDNPSIAPQAGHRPANDRPPRA